MFESLTGKLKDKRSVNINICQLDQDNGKTLFCFYINARILNK